MISFPAATSIIIVHQPVSFASGIDRMRGLCLALLDRDPLQHGYFVFINKGRNQLRVLWYDGQGFCLLTKRLSHGRFIHWPRPGEDIFSLVTYFHAQGLFAGHRLDDSSYLPLWKKIETCS